MAVRTYKKQALRTENLDFPGIMGRILTMQADEKSVDHHTLIRLLHAGMGLASEAGEFTDALKKYLFYGKPLDKANLVEELGDLRWFMEQAADALGVSMYEIEQANIRKLSVRYPEQFTEDKAVNRDLGAEQQAVGGTDGR